MFEPFGLIVLFIVVYVLTNFFTEMITNKVAAVIMFPIAYQIAVDTGMDTIGMAILVAVTASASFLSPIGYQTNLIVYGPGGYKFSDYLRVGFPLTLMTMIVTVSVIAMVYT
ncbi:SLC13 family permease [Salimicrobium salexigens]|uniref:Sodium:sulfate symporter transmembrane region n=1 Tax=Salimicrobium salexigens TaxID=908941 RepID=A0ABY1KZB0_9BACI|nr:anion permease [Salimicrobium salexigens]SIS82964.1 Sodium:sulfate symporter transmembrane region [Salimicrobium salexigens]